MRAKDPEQETAQQNRLSDQKQLSSFTPFVFEALLCKFIYQCLFIMPTQGNHMKGCAQVSCYILTVICS